MRALCSVLFLSAACAADADPVCTNDDDCVAATCCHAEDAVHVDDAPVCDVPCTADHQACTDDDDGVAPVCDDGRCAMAMPPWCWLGVL